MTLRPEPLIALATAATLLLTELARRRRSLAALAAATTIAAIALTVSPAGLVAAAPLVLALPWLWGWLRARPRSVRIAAVLTLAAAATAAVPIAFTDATLGDILEATAVHHWYYTQYPWYQEWFGYQKLLDNPEFGPWGRRLPVLLTLAVLLGGLVVAAGRRGAGGPTGRLLRTSAATTALGLLAMTPTPTKWVNHFGAIAAPATVLLAVAALRGPLPRGARPAAVAAMATTTGLAAVLAFSGPNTWRPFTDWGQPFGNHLAVNGTPAQVAALAPHLGPLFLRNPLVWLAVALAGLWWAGRRRRGGSPDRAVVVAALVAAAALMIATFGYAPLRQYPGWSVALGGVRALAGEPCGLAGAAQADGRPVADVIAGRPVFADQVSAALWPCADQVAVAHGIAGAPAFRLRTADGIEDLVLTNAVDPGLGGSFAGVAATAQFTELPSALDPPGVATLGWGHVERVGYDHPVGLVDLRVGQTERWGWTRLPTLATEAYVRRPAAGR